MEYRKRVHAKCLSCAGSSVGDGGGQDALLEVDFGEAELLKGPRLLAPSFPRPDRDLRYRHRPGHKILFGSRRMT